MKRNNPYSEIINLNAELSEYKKLCRGKSKKYTKYTEWKDHIIELLSKIENERDLIDFKHYCINIQRPSIGQGNLFVQLILVLLSIYLTLVSVPYKEAFLVICFVVLTAMTVIAYNDLEMPNRFYGDVLEIISEMEKKPDGEKENVVAVTVK